MSNGKHGSGCSTQREQIVRNRRINSVVGRTNCLDTELATVDQTSSPDPARPAPLILRKLPLAARTRTANCALNALSDQHIQSWRRLCDSDARFASPFYRPEFCAEVAAVREHVEVGLLTHPDSDDLVGVFPFERVGEHAAEPVGGIASDYHAVITPMEVGIAELDQFMHSWGLHSFRFHHSPTFQEAFAGQSCFMESSPRIDLSCGLEGYREDLAARGSKFLKRTRQRIRKLGREHGSVRLRLTRDASEYETLCEWKQLVCQQQMRSNIYDQSWSLDLFRRILQTDSAELSGQIAVLEAGSSQVAMLFLIRSHDVLHVWKIGINPDFIKYSPGLLVLRQLIEVAAEQGVRTIDLGRGEERFKRTMQNDERMVCEGWIGGPAWLKHGRCAWLAGKRQIRDSVFERPAKQIVRWVRRFGDRLLPQR